MTDSKAGILAIISFGFIVLGVILIPYSDANPCSLVFTHMGFLGAGYAYGWHHAFNDLEDTNNEDFGEDDGFGSEGNIV